MQVQQGGAGGFDQLGQLFVRGLLSCVDPFEVCDQLGGDPASGLADHVTWPHRRQQRLGLGGRQVLLRTARDQLEQQLVQLGGLARVLIAQRAASVDQKS